MTQDERVLDYLEQGNRITPLEALDLFQTMRLGAIIHRLKKHHDIRSLFVRLPNGKHVKQYWLVKKSVSLVADRKVSHPSTAQALFNMNSLDIKKP